MLTLSQPPLTCLSSTFLFRSPSITRDESLKQLTRSHGCSCQRRTSSLLKLKVAAKAMAEQPGTGGDVQASPYEKLQRLEMMLVKIHSTVEVSAKHAVENTWVVQRGDALKEAASEGDEALAFFRQRAMEDAGVVTGSFNELDDAASAAALFFTANALSGVGHGVRDRANDLFSGEEDTERLNVAVETLQQLSPDVAEAIRLLQLEILPKMEQSRPATRKKPLPPLLLHDVEVELERRRQNPATRAWPVIIRPTQRRPAPPAEGRLGRIKEAIRDEICREMHDTAPWQRPMEAWIADTPEYRDYQAWDALLRRLSPLVVGGRIGWAVKMMLDRDVEACGALATWAAVLREAQRRGSAVLLDVHRYLRRYVRFGDDEPPPQRAPHGRERDEVHALLQSLEMLAGDVESFGSLVVLCPWDISVR